MTIEINVWDLPLRLFHWLLALAVAGAIITGEIGGNLIDWHGRIGVFIAGLLAFRIVWGFLGSTHARFASFFPTPARIAAYLKGQWQRPGHNPLGALSVFALLAALSLLVGLGLFANDDIAFNGPLSSLVDKDLSDKLSGWHARIFNGLLIGLVGLHLAAIAFYARVKKKNLVVPMLTGRTVAPAGTETAMTGGGIARFAAALAIAVAVGWSASGGLLAPQPKAVPAATPASAPPGW
ncbi:MAG TPA: cytochrome b/b6 domain-containing protein [Gallionella sp.]|nr:cytochrome b/b6 domain-containing protein [Gallionella sp.]